MDLVKASFEIVDERTEEEILTKLERCGRVSYKSEEKITSGSAREFVLARIRDGHETVIEHESLTVVITCDRGVTHQLVRHRLASYTQESTRYTNYYKRGIQFIIPIFWEENSPEYQVWIKAMESSEQAYNSLIKMGASPQQARSVLPNSLKAEIYVSANVRQWRYMLKLGTGKGLQPEYKELFLSILSAFKSKYPTLFGDIPSATSS